MPELTVAAAEAAARKVLDPRVSAVRSLAETRSALTRARNPLADAEKADTATWAATLRAGGTQTDLRRVGFAPSPAAGPDDPAPPRTHRPTRRPADDQKPAFVDAPPHLSPVVTHR